MPCSHGFSSLWWSRLLSAASPLLLLAPAAMSAGAPASLHSSDACLQLVPPREHPHHQLPAARGLLLLRALGARGARRLLRDLERHPHGRPQRRVPRPLAGALPAVRPRRLVRHRRELRGRVRAHARAAAAVDARLHRPPAAAGLRGGRRVRGGRRGLRAARQRAVLPRGVLSRPRAVCGRAVRPDHGGVPAGTAAGVRDARDGPGLQGVAGGGGGV